MQTLDESLNVFRLAASFDLDPVRIVAHPPGQLQLFGQAQGKWTQTNTLHNPGKPDALANNT